MSGLPIFDLSPVFDSSWPSNSTDMDEMWQLPDLNNFEMLLQEPIVAEAQSAGPGSGGETLDPRLISTVGPAAEETTSLERVYHPLSGVSFGWSPEVNQRTEGGLKRDPRNPLVLLELGSSPFGSVNLIFDKRKPEFYVRKTLTPLPTATLDKTAWNVQLAKLKKVCMDSAHRNIIQIFRRRLLVNKDCYIIDMEVLELSLTNYLYSPQTMPSTLQIHSPYHGNNQNEDKSATVWEIMSQVISGLAFIHENEVVHGNLKPSNVLYSYSSSSWKLADLGLTSLMFKNDQNSISRSNFFGYQAPELFAPGSKASVKSDTWSSGCLLFEMVSLKKPFDSYADMSEFRRGRDLLVSSLLQLKQVAQEYVSKIIRETLLLDPQNRPDSNTLLDIFKRLLNDSTNAGRDQRNGEIRVVNFAPPNYCLGRAQVEATHSVHKSRARRPLKSSKPVGQRYNTRSNAKRPFKCPSRGCSKTFARKCMIKPHLSDRHPKPRDVIEVL